MVRIIPVDRSSNAGKPNNVTAKLPVIVWICRSTCPHIPDTKNLILCLQDGGGFLNGTIIGYPGEGLLGTAFQLVR
jgi:hypothetical protein